MDDVIFYNWSNKKFSIDEIAIQIKRWIVREPSGRYKVIIGADSCARDATHLVGAVTIWRVGNGAIHFWTKGELKNYHSMRERIWDEALFSIMLAQEMRTKLKNILGDDFFWDGNEVHVDIGKNGKTKDLVDSISGMIRGYEFDPVVKPFAFGASVVADRHT